MRPPPRFQLLLAEDNLPDTLLIREAVQMENLPLEMHTVRDGQGAIDFIARAEQDETAPGVDLVLLDLNLPKRHGFEVLKRLRESPKFGTVPVLIVTSSDAPSDHEQAAQFGASYFRKPPSYEEFLKLSGAVKKLMEQNGMM